MIFILKVPIKVPTIKEKEITKIGLKRTLLAN